MTTKTVSRVQCLYFSPTGSTRKVVETVAKGTGLPAVGPISITTPLERDSFFGQVDGDLLIVGVPVYAGKIPFVRAFSPEQGRWSRSLGAAGCRLR